MLFFVERPMHTKDGLSVTNYDRAGCNYQYHSDNGFLDLNRIQNHELKEESLLWK